MSAEEVRPVQRFVAEFAILAAADSQEFEVRFICQNMLSTVEIILRDFSSRKQARVVLSVDEVESYYYYPEQVARDKYGAARAALAAA